MRDPCAYRCGAMGHQIVTRVPAKTGPCQRAPRLDKALLPSSRRWTMSRVPMLAATTGPLQGARYEITEEGILLGRDPECAVAIPDQGISRQHARLLYRSGEVWVQDAGSRNGVFVNGKRVTRPKSVGPGDKITLGDHAFTVEMAVEDPEHSVTANISAELAGALAKPAQRAPTAGWVIGVAILAVVVAVLVLYFLP